MKKLLVIMLANLDKMLYNSIKAVKIMIPEKCIYILSELEKSGFQAYIVGGCVRDMIMGRTVNDFDITTDALPNQVIEIFSEDRVIPTGIKHGTVTVIHEGESFEITTFRVDGSYTDSRRPDNVSFTSSLQEDLARRDFTMNAVAMDLSGKIFDFFGGVSDIENKLIRCVGEPEQRFGEDALRILRAVRFASVLNFEIVPETAESAIKLKDKLDFISAERIRSEFVKLLCGENVVDTLMRYREIIGQIIPEIKICFDFNQQSKYHRYDVYEHIVRAVGMIPVDSENAEILRTSLFFHDIGKPAVFWLDENGRGHFGGHAGKSAEIAEEVMHKLKFDNKTIDTVCTIIAHHSDNFDFGNEDRKSMPVSEIKRMISKIGGDRFFLLLELKKADNSAKHDFVLNENNEIENISETAHRIIDENCCIKISQLAVNGDDLLELGFQGREIGRCLEILLENVIDESVENDYKELMKFAKEML